MINNIKIHRKNQGVTLVGVIVGITILSIALAAQIRLLGNTIRRDTELRNVIIATNLAREGIEILFSWRATEGWEKLMPVADNNKILCTDIKQNIFSQSELGEDCIVNQKLNFINYSPGTESFKAYLYGSPDANSPALDAPPFWRALTIKNCDPGRERCLVLVSTVGWENCDPNIWRSCVTSPDGQCDCKLIKLEKKIYNWYVP